MSLKPGATYIYERVDNVVYSREIGSDERVPVGWDHPHATSSNSNDSPRSKLDQLLEDKLWGEIRREARTNPALQKALDRAILIYRLSKDNPE